MLWNAAAHSTQINDMQHVTGKRRLYLNGHVNNEESKFNLITYMIVLCV